MDLAKYVYMYIYIYINIKGFKGFTLLKFPQWKGHHFYKGLEWVTCLMGLLAFKLNAYLQLFGFQSVNPCQKVIPLGKSGLYNIPWQKEGPLGKRG